MIITKSKLIQIIKEELENNDWEDDPYNLGTIPERQYIADDITNAAMKAVLDMAAEKFNFEKEKVQHLELHIEEKLLDVALEIADIIIDARY